MPSTNSLVVLVVCLFLGIQSHADTIFVDNISGSDSNNGASPEHKGEGTGPLKSIGAALNRVRRGDKIELAKTDSPYKECVTVQGRRHSGTSFQPFLIDGNGATLEGIETVPAHRWEHVYQDVFRFTPDRTGYQQLFIDGTAAKRMPKFDAMYNTSFLAPEQWCRCKGGIHFSTKKGKSVHSYELSYAKHRVGITLYDVENVVIHNLKVRGFQLDGINAHDNAFDCVLSDVTATENGRSGVSVGGSSRLHLAKCVLRDNGDSQFRAEGWSTTKFHGTKTVSKELPAWKRETTNGRGARLIIDDIAQIDVVGWRTEQDEEDEQLKDGLDRLEDEADATEIDALERDLNARKDEPVRPNPLLDVAEDNGPAVENPATDDGPIFEDEPSNEEEPVNEEVDDPFGDEDPFGDAADEASAENSDGDLFDDGEAMEDDSIDDLFE